MRQHLRRETAELHRRVEAQLGLLVEPGLSIDRYRRVLETLHGFYSPIESVLEQLAAAGAPVGFSLRRRSRLIERDLVALGLSRRAIADLHQCADLPRLACTEDLAGCLYVLEGACLGGQVIAPRLQRSLGMSDESGLAFFAGDGDATSARWMQVIEWLDASVRAGARSAAIVASACATFHALDRWVEEERSSWWT